ncbi:hypothetical protein M9458_056471, partial [Cirrhinus mrigala]
ECGPCSANPQVCMEEIEVSKDKKNQKSPGGCSNVVRTRGTRTTLQYVVTLLQQQKAKPQQHPGVPCMGGNIGGTQQPKRTYCPGSTLKHRRNTAAQTHILQHKPKRLNTKYKYNEED